MPLRPFYSCPSLCIRSAQALTLCLVAMIIGNPASSQERSHVQKAMTITNLPVGFEPNEGQAEPPVRFVAHTKDLNISLRPLGVDLLLGCQKGKTSTLSLNFVGGNPNTSLVALDEQASYSNYLLGADPSKWLRHVPNFSRVTYRGLYPGVDAIFYGNGARLEHDYIVEPGGDYRLIRVRVDGPRQIHLQTDGSLKILFPDGELIFQKPQAYQLSGGSKTARQGRFVLLSKREFGFAVGDYDKTKPLIIDPVLSYSTYLADVSVVMAGVATDAAGDTFLTGLVFSPNFPVTPGAYQTTCKSCGSSIQQPDVFVTKINA